MKAEQEEGERGDEGGREGQRGRGREGGGARSGKGRRGRGSPKFNTVSSARPGSAHVRDDRTPAYPTTDGS